jgi:hypothetical protein
MLSFNPNFHRSDLWPSLQRRGYTLEEHLQCAKSEKASSAKFDDKNAKVPSPPCPTEGAGGFGALHHVKSDYAIELPAFQVLKAAKLSDLTIHHPALQKSCGLKA